MWKCQNCETLNDGDTCVVCGEAKPAVVQEPVKPQNNKTEYAPPSYDAAPKYDVPPSYDTPPRYDMYYAPPKNNTAKIVAIILAFALIFVLGVMGTAFYMITRDDNTNSQSDKDDVTYLSSQEPVYSEQATVAPTPMPTQNPTIAPIVTPPPTPEPSTNTQPMTAEDSGFMLSDAPDISEINSYPEYNRIVSPTYSYECIVPSHFKHTPNSGTYYAPDNTAVMQINAYENTNNLTPKQAMNNYINSIGGNVTYSVAKNDYFAASIIKDNVGYYIKGYADHYIRYFTFTWPMKYDAYKSYIEYIEDNFKRTDITN